jgi:hypothetical protein
MHALFALMLQRVEEPDAFIRALYEAPPGRAPTERVLQQEADDFAAFASAFGVVPPGRGTLGSGGGA